MKKITEFCLSPWPMLMMTALGVVVMVATSLDWTYSQLTDEPTVPPQVNRTQP